MKMVYTIGYAGREISNFIRIMKDHHVTTVVDVRRFPKSKDPAFEKEKLNTILVGSGIKYIFLGESLGGFVKGGYEQYMKTPKFKDGFNILLGLIDKEVVAIMCKERNVKYCHRRFISNLLQDQGFDVQHI
ncbi:DUF488 domain-containing protein [Candidatus Bathyarchaeota archaeon]|nr:DUF488 domain-containing protein [Candidatus Bathyarchaeota archaeon]